MEAKQKKDYSENEKQTKHHNSDPGMTWRGKRIRCFSKLLGTHICEHKQKQTILDAAGHCWWISSTNTRSLALEWSDNQLRGRSMFQTNFNRGRFNMSLTLRSQHPTSVDTFRFEGSGSTSLHVFEDGHRGWVERISNRKLTLMNHFFPTSNTTWCPLNVLLAQFFSVLAKLLLFNGTLIDLINKSKRWWDGRLGPLGEPS